MSKKKKKKSEEQWIKNDFEVCGPIVNILAFAWRHQEKPGTISLRITSDPAKT
jgi:hypothetical protein